MSCRRWLPALLIVYGLSPSSQPAKLHSFQAGPARARHDDYTQGLTYYRSKEYAAAVEAFNRALKENPGSPWLIYHLARSHLHLKNRAAAEVLAKKLVHEDPSFARGYFLLGYIQFEERQYPLAEQNLRRAVQLEPAYWESHQALGLTYVLQDRHEEAEEELREAVQLNPNDPDAHYYMGRLYSTRSKFVAALEEFSKMRDLDPLSVKAYNNLGTTRLALNQVTAAIADFQKAMELGTETGNPSEWPYINLGKFYYERGKRDQGLALLKRAVEINPQYDIGQYHLGKCLFALGLTEKARDAVEKAIDIHSKSPDYFYFLANICKKLGRMDEASAAFRRFEALRKKP